MLLIQNSGGGLKVRRWREGWGSPYKVAMGRLDSSMRDIRAQASGAVCLKTTVFHSLQGSPPSMTLSECVIICFVINMQGRPNRNKHSARNRDMNTTLVQANTGVITNTQHIQTQTQQEHVFRIARISITNYHHV